MIELDEEKRGKRNKKKKKKIFFFKTDFNHFQSILNQSYFFQSLLSNYSILFVFL